MTTATGPRPMTEAEQEAWTMHLQKVPIPSIEHHTKLTPAQIAAAVDLGQVHAQLRMQSSTAVLLETPAQPKLPTVTVRSSTAGPALDDGRIPVGRLLAWAEETGPSKAKTLAARIKAQIDELRTIHAENDARTKAQAEVDRLTAELEAAKNALRQAGGSTNTRRAGAKPSAEARARAAAIRAWAPGAGFEVSVLGRIPQHIEDAYDAAHPAAS
jgi:hypothetical protein